MTDEKEGKSNQADPQQAESWNGTLLKCPGCRLKFPFIASSHPLRIKRFPPGSRGGDARDMLVTDCPQCQGWVTIS